MFTVDLEEENNCGCISGLEFMNNVAKEIIKIKPDNNKSISDLWDDFYDIMRRYGIKEGIRTEGGGRLTANFEWTMCVSLFIDTITSSINFDHLFSDSLPEDLLCYEEAPYDIEN